MSNSVTMHRSLIAVLGLGHAGCGLEEPTRDELRSGEFTVSFQDGVAPTASYAGTRDTMLEQDSPKTSNGGDSSLSVSGDTPGGSTRDIVALVRWDLAAKIPAGAVVSEASITLQISDRADQSYAIHEVLRPWTESQATWNLAATAAAWAGAGASGAGDRGAAVLGSITAPATGSVKTTLNAAGLAAVQRWVDDPASNNGVVFSNTYNDNRLEFRASEYGTKSARPRLTVSWDLPTVDSDSDEDPFALVPTPGHYRGTCDGSGAVAIDGGHFLDFNDEDQVLRIYAQGADAAPVQSLDISASLGLAPGDEADLEDAARVGDRVYVIGSHARDKNGTLEAARYRFFAIDLAGAVPTLQLQFAGMSSHLLVDLLEPGNWVTPNATILAQLASTSQLAKGAVASLAPKDQGTNIEGLAALDDSGALVIGFRNPRASAKAIVVTLLNPDAVIVGATAHFGEAIVLDLASQAIRGMAWSTRHDTMLLLAGPRDEAQGPFALWKWSGIGSPPVKVQDLVAPAAGGPEAVIPYPGTRGVQVLFDMGAYQIGGDDCKVAASSARHFTDVVVHVDG